MTYGEEHWSAIIERFRKTDSLEFCVQKTLVTPDDPNEMVFLRTLAQRKKEELEQEQDIHDG
ncbi:hypothetical protein [Enterobacter sp. UPMP2052]